MFQRAGEFEDLEAPTVELLEEVRRWRSRCVRYYAGTWQNLKSVLPEFELRVFATADDGPPNPFYRSVIRLPLAPTEREMPVGIVSQTYQLVQHCDVGKLCLDTLRQLGFAAEELRCEVGISDLGEWANLRFELPAHMQFCAPDGHPLKLRLEIFNSVDGSSKLVALMSWFRQVCSNGMVVRDTMVDVSDKHDRYLNLNLIRQAIGDGIRKARADQKQLEAWNSHPVSHDELIQWADGALLSRWGVKAATRVLHVCQGAMDVDFADPFEGGKPSERMVIEKAPVPGAPAPAQTRYDVAQALSWVASTRTNAEQRVLWQSEIPFLMRSLARSLPSSRRLERVSRSRPR